MRDFQPVLTFTNPTGLPDLPDGYFFRVERQMFRYYSYVGDPQKLGPYLAIRLMRKRTLWFAKEEGTNWLYGEDGEKTSDPDDLAPNQIKHQAELLARKFYIARHQQESKTKDHHILGDYPPNSIRPQTTTKDRFSK